jgi:magnesium chelatase subunit D
MSVRAVRPVFPFTAIVGQERMRLALLLHAVAPALGGVLVRGKKGTAKSTAVRALAALLPEIERVEGCPFGCDPRDAASACDGCAARIAAGETLRVERARVPVVELPIGATEDRVVGSLDLESAIQSGERRFDPGLLARANRGILYMDEVNLLGDHLVDLLLDAAAMGRNYVEREGVSVSHPAQVMLVGTMNPEEGELRPQLLDRFALAVEVDGLEDAAERVRAVQHRLAFERNPQGFIAARSPAEAEVHKRLERARALLPRVELPPAMLDLAVQLCARFGVDGLRADLALCRAAVALAAYRGRTAVTQEDVREVAPLVLAHRRRRQPFEQPGIDEQQLDDAIAELAGANGQRDGGEEGDSGKPDQDTASGEASAPMPAPAVSTASAGERTSDPKPAEAPAAGSAADRWTAPSSSGMRLTLPELLARVQSESRGRRRAAPEGRRGQAVRSGRPRGQPRELALIATLRAAAPFQRSRRVREASRLAILLRKDDVRERIRRGRGGSLVLFTLDASGSMGARERMAATKRNVLDLLLDVYRRRDRVAMIVFRGEGAAVALPPTNSVDLAQQGLVALKTGGRTPLAAGLRLAGEMARRANGDGSGMQPLLVLVSDGRANQEGAGADPWRAAEAEARRWRSTGWPSVVLDTEAGHAGAGLARSVAGWLGAVYLRGGTGTAAGSQRMTVS